MRIACLQYDPVYLEVEENLETVEALLHKVDADLLVFPELFATGYFFRTPEDLAAVAESIPEGPTTQRLLAWAQKRSMTVVAGLPERGADGAIYNSAVVVGPGGVLGTYRKVHLYYEEKSLFAPGTAGFPVFDGTARDGSPYRLGVMICFDWYFPESARSLALAGAEIIAHPSNLVRPHCPSAMPIRALENHVFTATANRIGEESNGHEILTFIGQSLICAPNAEVLARAGRVDEGWIVAEVEPSRASNRQLTRTNDLFADRRPALYKLD